MKRKIYVGFCLVIILAIIINLSQGFVKVNEAAASIVKGTVIIDAGHGGEDGGTIGINKVFEKDINLPISLLLKELFIRNGYRVVMTREEDVDLGDSSLNSVAERKRSDIKKRTELILKSGADILLSIHQNHFEQSKYHGAQIFYASEQSKKLADTLQKTIVTALQPENNRIAKKTDSVFILNKSQIVSVIVECGFISNRDEADLLITAEYQSKMAEAIYSGAIEYLSNR